jgi:hypothetical protein
MTQEEICEWRLNRIIKERDEKKLLFTNYKSPFIKETIKSRPTQYVPNGYFIEPN